MAVYDWQGFLILAILFLVASVIYLSPALIAYTRQHPRRRMIAALNLILGVTVIFWVVTFVWAFVPGRKGKVGKDAVSNVSAWRHRLSIIHGVFVLGVIGMIIAVPYFLRSCCGWKAVAPASAIGSVRLIKHCAECFRAAHPDLGFPTSIHELGPISGGGTGCLDSVLTAATAGGAPKTHYHFAYIPGEPNSEGVVETFTVTARPAEYSYRGSSFPSFLSDPSLTIYETEEDRAATRNDRAIVRESSGYLELSCPISLDRKPETSGGTASPRD